MPLKNASAIDLVAPLNRLFEPSTGVADSRSTPTQRVTLVADPRSNSVLLRSDNPARVARVRQLVEQLDTPDRAAGNIFIVYLKNAEATKVAQTLRAI